MLKTFLLATTLAFAPIIAFAQIGQPTAQPPQVWSIWQMSPDFAVMSPVRPAQPQWIAPPTWQPPPTPQFNAPRNNWNMVPPCISTAQGVVCR